MEPIELEPVTVSDKEVVYRQLEANVAKSVTMDCMQNPILQVIKAKYTSLEPVLDERARRLWAGAEARAIGRGGITRVAQAIGLSRVTVRAGLKELDLPITPAAGRETLRRLRRVGQRR